MERRGATTRLLAVGIFGVTLLMYLRSLTGYFLGDDLGFLHSIAQGAREDRLLPQLAAEWTTAQARGGFFYRPMVTLAFAVDYVLWGVNPTGWHITNLLLHLLNGMLLWRLVDEMVKRSSASGGTLVGALAAALFLLRPSSPETVAWISGRSDALALFGYLFSMWAYVRASGRRCLWIVLSLAGFLLALSSKEAAITLPGGLLALHLSGLLASSQPGEDFGGRAWFFQTLRGLAPFLAILALYVGLRGYLFGTPFTVYRDAPEIALHRWAWWATKVQALGFFLMPAVRTTGWSVLFMVATLCQLLIGFASIRWPGVVRRLWIVGLTWLLATLLPLGQQLLVDASGEGARLFYIPSAPLSILLAAPLAGAFRVFSPPRPFLRRLSTAGAMGALILVCLSPILLKGLLQPWVEAGRSMRALPAAIEGKAAGVPEGTLALLLIPDHHGGALFGRNGQGALMEPPVQATPLQHRVLVLTPPTLRIHGPRLASSPVKLEPWCWKLNEGVFERLRLEEHDVNTWLQAWVAGLEPSSCRALAEELKQGPR